MASKDPFDFLPDTPEENADPFAFLPDESAVAEASPPATTDPFAFLPDDQGEETPGYIEDIGTGLKAGAMGEIRSWLQQVDEYAVPDSLDVVGLMDILKETVTPEEQPQTIPGKVAAGVAATPGMIARYGTAASLGAAAGGPLGSIAAMGAVGAAEGGANAPEGEKVEGALEGAAWGAGLGAVGNILRAAGPVALPFTEGAVEIPKALISTGTMAALGAKSAEEEGNLSDMVAGALTFGGMEAVPAAAAKFRRGETRPEGRALVQEAKPEAAPGETAPAIPQLKPSPAKEPVKLAPDTTAEAMKAADSELGKAIEVAPAAPTEKRAANIQLSKLNTAGEVKGMIETLAKASPEKIDEARRGEITWERTDQLAAELGMTRDELMKRKVGEAFNAEQLDAARSLLIKTGEELKVARDNFLQDRSDSNKAAFGQALIDFRKVTESVIGAEAESGRALQILRRTAHIREEGKRTAALIEAMEAEGLSMEARAERLAEAKSTSELKKEGEYTPTKFEKFLEYWKASMLSSPETLSTNVISTTTSIISNAFAYPVAAVGGKIAMRPERVSGAEAKARLSVTATGFAKALKDAVPDLINSYKYFTGPEPEIIRKDAKYKNELTEFKTVESAAAPPNTEYSRGKIGGRFGRAVRVPFALLNYTDNALKKIVINQELYGQAARDAHKEGFRGNELRQEVNRRVEELKALAGSEEVTGPVLMARLQIERAADVAKKQTFQTDFAEGSPGEWAQQGLKDFKVFQLALPFFKTPVNLAKVSAEWSPLAPVLKSVRNDLKSSDPIARHLAMTRMAIGTSAMTAVISKAINDEITGYGPSDPNERQVWLANHQPYSIRFGDTWYSYQRVVPFIATIGMAADIGNAIGSGTFKEREFYQNAVLALAGFVYNMKNVNFLQGLSTFLDVTNGPDESKLQNFLNSYVGSILPGTGALAAVAKAGDTVQRDVRGLMGPVMNRIPGLREDLPVKINPITGEFYEQENLGPDPLIPVATRKAVDSPVAAEMARLGMSKDFPSRKMKIRGEQREMTDEAYELYQSSSAKLAHEKIKRVMQTTSWQIAPDEKRKKYINDTYDKARESMRARLTEKDFTKPTHTFSQ